MFNSSSIVFNKLRLGNHFWLFNENTPIFYRNNLNEVQPEFGTRLVGLPDIKKFSFLKVSPVPTIVGRFAADFAGSSTDIIVSGHIS